MTTTPARDELRKYVNLLADSWTPRERTDERVEWLYSLVRAEVLRTFTQTEARAEADRHAAEVRAAALTEAANALEAACPDHTDHGGRLMTCQCEAAGDLREAAAAHPDNTTRGA